MLNYAGFLLFRFAVSMLFTNIEINWLSSSIKGSSFDAGFIRFADSLPFT